MSGRSAAARAAGTAATDNPVRRWLTDTLGWRPFGFQEQTWSAYLAGDSGLVHAPTGMGKTYAAWLGPLMQWCARHPDPARWADLPAPPLTVLWVTPLRALAVDTAASLAEPVAALGMPWTIELRTGDVSSSVKARQRRRLPSALVTTPESLSLLLSYPESQALFAHLRCVVVDEWHELMSTKRGTQTELGLARLRAWNPGLATWGMSATLGNLEEARDALLGAGGDETGASARHLVRGPDHKDIVVETLRPDDIARFPWAGHLGINLLEGVLEQIDAARSTLLFTNTRSQAEIWFNRITQARPDWLGTVALHHGSLDRERRGRVETMLRAGDLRCVVCTSSLDLGVDFSPVDQVMQVGSPKGVARLMQRAGRSGHQPGAVSRVVGVPAHALELVEFAAARSATAARNVESRRPLDRQLDVLVQHLVTLGLGGGFDPAAALAEVRTAWAYRNLTDREWAWCLDFVTRGGPALGAYPQYARLVERDGRMVAGSRRIAQMHRMAIGTITSDAQVAVKFVSGRTLGTVEESFVGRMRPGDRFIFAGHVLELVRYRQMVAQVRRARGRKSTVPRWQGGKSPLSTQLADAVRDKLDGFAAGRVEDPELEAVAPLLRLQLRWSVIPRRGELLIETHRSREGAHAFVYPFEGRLVHEGLGALAAYRLTRDRAMSISVTVNDYGLELLTEEPLGLDAAGWRALLTPDRLVEDLLACLNSSELARRQFRGIARVAGLVFTGFPGEGRSARQLQASSELFYDVLSDFDPENLLLDQARREVLERQLEVSRLDAALGRLAGARIVERAVPRLSPLSFPLWAEHLREQHVSTEAWQDRVMKMAAKLEAAALQDGAGDA